MKILSNKRYQELLKKEEQLRKFDICRYFDIRKENFNYTPETHLYWESNIEFQNAVNEMIDDVGRDYTFNGVMSVRYICENLYRAGYRKLTHQHEDKGE